MKDKVYFDQHTASFNYESKKPDDVTYIRKEAILEWAKAKHMELDPPQNERDFDRIEAVEELIDKINSL